MPKRLPLLPELELALRQSPTVVAMRKQLGGRPEGEGFAMPGRAVTTKSGDVGIICSQAEGETYLWLGANRAVKVKSQPQEPPASLPPELEKAAQQLRWYGEIEEGEMVTFFLRGGGSGAGKLVEKCRFGGLVLRDDGKIQGVGFARLAPYGARLH